MDTIINSTVKDTNQRVTVDFQYFITSAIQKEFSWKTLAFFLTDLTTTLDQSREVIRLLVQELEVWVGKASSERVDSIAKNGQNILQSEETCKVTKEAKDFVKFEQSSENEEFLMKDEIVETPSSEEWTEEKFIHDDNKDEIIPDIQLSRFYEFVGSNENDQTQEKDKSAFNVKGKNQCNICGKTFHNKDLHLMHINPKDCEICKKTFCNTFTFKKHECYQTFEKPFQCNTCGEHFRRRLTLEAHERIHTGEKPFQCKICKMCFRVKNKLAVHDRTHTGERPFQCKMCSKAFKSSWNLRRHKKIHAELETS